MNDQAPGPPPSLDDVKGWFPHIDQRLFTWFLERQDRLAEPATWPSSAPISVRAPSSWGVT